MRFGKRTLLPALFFHLILVMVAPNLAFAQDKPIFEAKSDARQVVLNGFFEVVFTLKNGSGDRFQAPDLSEFKVVSGPNDINSVVNLNGRIYREMGYSYTLVPKRIGKITIGSASVRVNGQTLRTQPLVIEVVKAQKEGSNQDNEIFIRAETSSKDAYPGQQILLDYKVYFKNNNIEAYDVIEESDYQGFFARDIRRVQSSRTQEVIKGKQYTSVLLKRVALFPQQIGQLPIGSLSVQLGIMEDAPLSNNFPRLFFNQQLTRVAATSEPLSVAVKPLPNGAPASFCGAVGQYEMTTSISRNALSTDDALAVRLSVWGNGDSKRIQPPAGIFPESFEVYEPKVIEETAFDKDGQVMSEKVFEYLILPKKPGTYTIAPELSVFDPETKKYTAIKGGSFEVQVSQGKGERKPLEPDGFEALKDDEANSASGNKTGVIPAWLLWTGLPLILLSGVLWGRKYFRKLTAQRTASEMQADRAEKIAKSHLATAHAHLLTGESGAFYEEVSRAMLGYACRKFNIPLSVLNRENLQQKLQETSLPAEQISQFTKIIQTCDMALYAGMDNAAKMEETYQQAQASLVQMERLLK